VEIKEKMDVVGDRVHHENGGIEVIENASRISVEKRPNKIGQGRVAVFCGKHQMEKVFGERLRHIAVQSAAPFQGAPPKYHIFPGWYPGLICRHAVGVSRTLPPIFARPPSTSLVCRHAGVERGERWRAPDSAAIFHATRLYAAGMLPRVQNISAIFHAARYCGARGARRPGGEWEELRCPGIWTFSTGHANGVWAYQPRVPPWIFVYFWIRALKGRGTSRLNPAMKWRINRAAPFQGAHSKKTTKPRVVPWAGLPPRGWRVSAVAGRMRSVLIRDCSGGFAVLKKILKMRVDGFSSLSYSPMPDDRHALQN